MAARVSGGIAGPLRSIFGPGSMLGLADAELIDRFLDGGPGAEPAFAALVERHGPMVLRVCRATLCDDHEAHDAFQAAFLVLARRAGSIRRRGSVAPWLHGVAARVAAKARRRLVRRRLAEARRIDREGVAASYTMDTRPVDTWPELHEEVARLPSKYRDPIVLCYLEGRTHDEAAALLGWPVGTVRGRLSRARSRLRDRLIRRGLAPAVAALASPPLARPALALASSVRPIPPGLIRATLAATARGTARSSSLAGAIPAASSLTEGVLRVLSLHPLKAAVGTMAATLALTLGPGPSPSGRGEADEPPPAPPSPPTSSQPAAASDDDRATDPNLRPRSYVVLDLVPGPGLVPDLEPLIAKITSTVAPGTWRGRDSRGGSVERIDPDAVGMIVPMPGSVGLTILHTESAHDHIAALLHRLRHRGRADVPGEAPVVLLAQTRDAEGPTPANDILDRWERRCREANSVLFTFTLVEELTIIGKRETYRGQAYSDFDRLAAQSMASIDDEGPDRGRRLVWRDGVGHEFDGQSRQHTIFPAARRGGQPTWAGVLHEAIARQLRPRPWDQQSSALGLAFRFDREEASETFRLVMMPDVGGQARVAIYPLGPEGRRSFSVAVVLLDAETGWPAAIHTLSPNGKDKEHIEITGIEIDVPPPPDLIDVSTPAGWHVLEAGDDLRRPVLLLPR